MSFHRNAIVSLGVMFLTPSVQSASETLNLYGSPEREWVAAVAQRFEKETGVKVNWIRASSNEMYARIEAEKANPRGDVWFGGTGDPHFDAARKGLTTPYCSPKMNDLREMVRDPIGSCKVIGLYAGPLGFGVNEGLLKKKGIPIPKSWADLTKPVYKGWIAMANPNTSGTAFTALTTILQLYGERQGWEYLAKLHKNIAQYTQSGSAPGQLAGRGEIAIAIIFLHDVVRYADEGFPLTPVVPSEGTGFEIGGLSLIKGAPHPELAKKFIDWALTPSVQEIARQHGSFQLPSNAKATVPDIVKKYKVTFDDVKTIKYDFDWAATHRDRLLKEWNTRIASLSRG